MIHCSGYLKVKNSASDNLQFPNEQTRFHSKFEKRPIHKKYELIDFDILTELQHITSQRGFRSSCSLVASLLHYRDQDAQQRFYVQVSFEFLINVMILPILP